MQRADHNMLTRGAEALGWTLQWTDALDRVHPHGSTQNQRLVHYYYYYTTTTRGYLGGLV